MAVGVAAFFAYQAYWAEQHRQVEQAQAQMNLQRVQREWALENALAAAMGGDLDRAEKAISEAETFGASIAQVRRLRGQVAFSRGDSERALVDLEEALKLDPDSVAARGMLAMAYLSFGDIDRYVHTATEMKALTPRTAEDYLFRGYAQQWLGTGLGLEDLNEGVKRSHSPLARAMRADSRKLLAENRADAEEAEQVLTDILAAKESLDDNPYVLSVSLLVHVMAANVYREVGKSERQQTLLEVAKRDALSLKRWDTLTSPFKSLWVYFEQTGQEPALFDLSRRAAENSTAPVFADRYAEALYRRGLCREALEVLERRKAKTFVGDNYRVFILAELHPQDLTLARAAYDEMASRYTAAGHVVYLQELLCLLGYKDEAVAFLRARVQQGSGPPWWKTHLDLLSEQISENEYLKTGDDGSKWGRLGAHHQVALMRLTKADKAGAREHLRQAVQTRVMLNYDADFCRSFLARMEKDDTWPPWIQVKK
jgi:tetratricopeptide (TPR) repeat protein